MVVNFVCGKGGVGKTTVTAALADYYAKRAPVLVVSIDHPEHLAECLNAPALTGLPGKLGSNLFGVHLDRQDVLENFLSRFLRLKSLSGKIVHHPAFPYLSSVAPGIREFLILDRIREFSSVTKRNPWKTVLIDTPATGHAIQLLNLPNQLTTLLKRGPLRSRLQKIINLLQDPEKTGVILVTIPGESPVHETIELHKTFTEKLSIQVSSLVINRCPESMDSGKGSRSKSSTLLTTRTKAALNTLLGKKEVEFFLKSNSFVEESSREAARTLYPLKRIECDQRVFLPHIPEVKTEKIFRNLVTALSAVLKDRDHV